MTRLSANFSLDEFTRSEFAARRGIAINVLPGSVIHQNLIRLCSTILQPLRDALGPVHVLSGYRPVEVNELIGGAPTSQHTEGLAADIIVSGKSHMEVAEWIRAHIAFYDQLILEFGQWVHVSAAPKGRAPRSQSLTAVKVPARVIGTPRTVYVPGLHDMEEALRRAA
jgi:hypothetical protein